MYYCIVVHSLTPLFNSLLKFPLRTSLRLILFVHAFCVLYDIHHYAQLVSFKRVHLFCVCKTSGILQMNEVNISDLDSEKF